MTLAMMLSVLIKTYNEEQKIAACLDAVFAALGQWGGSYEVIVADSRSDDATVAIASKYPVRIVVLSHEEPRGCGIGVQLGYQQARGDLILLLDGDMQLHAHFLSQAIAALLNDSSLAGVAGILEDNTVNNHFDRHRTVKKPSAVPGKQPWLNGGGLYRRAAIESAGGYAANRNLVAYEEAELGMRLGSKGWGLLRMPIPYVSHTGHKLSTLQVMRRMWSSGRLEAGGMLLRSALTAPWRRRALRMFAQPLAMILLWTFVLLASYRLWPTGLYSAPVVLFGLVAVQAMRRASVSHAFFSVLLWHLSAIGLIKGLLRSQASPAKEIKCQIVAQLLISAAAR